MHESVTFKLLDELKAMLIYAAGNGLAIPPDIMTCVNKLEDKVTSQVKDEVVEFTEEELQQLTAFHTQMADAVSPAKPNSIRQVQLKTTGILKFLGPVALVRQLTFLACFFLASTVLLALSESVNDISINQGLFDSSGITLLLNLLFLLSCAGLGATFSCLHQLFYYINNTTYDPKFNATYWIKIMMGVMSGLMLSELLPLDNLATDSASSIDDLDKPLIAMLGGFSSDLLYKILSRLLELVEQMFGSADFKPGHSRAPPGDLSLVSNNLQPVARTKSADSLPPLPEIKNEQTKVPPYHVNSASSSESTNLMSRPGQLTFDAEGTEGGRFHSRKLHVPADTSGLTIGRGYDCKEKSPQKIVDDLCKAGLDSQAANTLAQASGLAGEGARAFIHNYQLQQFEISPEVQDRLFTSTYEEMSNDVQRICSKPDCIAAYGAVDWSALNPRIRDVLVDLRYRGDYTPISRKLLQRHVANNDLTSFSQVVCDKNNWLNVPEGRFNLRRDYLTNN